MLEQRSTTLTAAHCDGGVRVYTKTCDGDVREGCNDTTEGKLLNALRAGQRGLYRLSVGVGISLMILSDVIDQGDGWFPGELRFKCSPDSTLCAIAVSRAELAFWPSLTVLLSILYIVGSLESIRVLSDR